MKKEFSVYVMTNKTNSVFYTGITSNLEQRVNQHKSHLIEGLTKLYKICKLIYFETYLDPNQAIAREKQIKNWTRKKKLALVAKINPNFKDLNSSW
jgi:putative endonuclease